MNSSSSYLISMLCKSSTNKYILMIKKCCRHDYEKYDKTIFFFKTLYKI